MVTGVMQFGVFVRGTDLPAEGALPKEGLGGGWFDHDATAHTLTSRDGVTYRLGMPLKVRVAKVDVEARVLEFELAEDAGVGRRRRSRGGTGPRTAGPAAGGPPAAGRAGGGPGRGPVPPPGRTATRPAGRSRSGSGPAGGEA